MGALYIAKPVHFTQFVHSHSVKAFKMMPQARRVREHLHQHLGSHRLEVALLFIWSELQLRCT